MAQAGELRKVWDFDAGAPGVYALSFSPDGHHIVAVVGPSWDKEFVIVLDAADPQADTRRFEINPKSYPYSRLLWSPSGKQLMIGNTRLRLADGNTCSFPDGAGLLSFFSEDRLAGVVNRTITPPTGNRPAVARPFLDVFDSGCQSAGVPDVSIGGLFDASAERGMICVRLSTHASIMDASGRTVLREFPSLGWKGPVRFADSGKAICGVIGPEWQVSVSCLDVDTAKELATTKEFAYLEINSSLHARRVVLSDYGRKFDFIELGWGLGSLEKRIVWDFGTNKDLVSWSPRSQKVITLGRPLGWSQPYAFDISPDGEYIVEGGAGTVSLYRIEP
jgi:WD40 repeat protein